MAEKIKDAEDRMLESLFASEPIADKGFSSEVAGRIRRRLWVRRLTLPIAVVIGGLISFKPLAGLVSALAGLSSLLPKGMVSSATQSLPGVQIIVMGAILLGVCLYGLRVIEE